MAASMDTPNLLALPYEVRQIILRALLYHPECNARLPLYLPEHPPKLYPAILSTCHQLHSEGLPLLYSHTLHFEIYTVSKTGTNGHNRATYGYRPIYIHRKFTPTNIPPAIAQRTATINLQVHARRTDGIYLLSLIQDQVRSVAKLIGRHPHWQHFSVRAYTSAGAPLNEAHVMQSLALQPFHPLGTLRRRTEVVYDGVDPDFAAELARVMTSTAAVVDMDDMYDELEALVVAVGPAASRSANGRCTETDFAGIRFAQDHNQLLDMLRGWVGSRRGYGDLPGFLAARLLVVRKVNALFEENQVDGVSVQMIQGDPAWIGGEIARLLAQDEGGAASTVAGEHSG